MKLFQLDDMYGPNDGHVCIIGLPGAGKSVLSKCLYQSIVERGLLRPPKIIGLVDGVSSEPVVQQRLLEFYKWLCNQYESRFLFDGWPLENDLDLAMASCGQVWLLCVPPWLHAARIRARGDREVDLVNTWDFYNCKVPYWQDRYRNLGKLCLVEAVEEGYRRIDDYPTWLKKAKDPTIEDEKNILSVLRPIEYQKFLLPFGGVIEGSESTELIMKKVMEFLPKPGIKRAVDVGCEFGKASFLLAQWGVQEVYALDHDERVITIARELNRLYGYHVEFSHMKGEFFNYNNVDLVVCLSVAHHLPEPQYLYSQIMRARWIVVELPIHKFSILEEAAQRLGRQCIAVWPSPKRDREIRIYSSEGDYLLYAARFQKKAELEEKERNNNDIVLDQITHHEIVPASEGKCGFYYSLVDSDQKVTIDYNIGDSGQLGMESTYERFLGYQYFPPSGVKRLICTVQYDIYHPQWVWSQIDWWDNQGNIKMVGNSCFFDEKNREVTFYQEIPLNIKELKFVRIVLRPNQSKSISIKGLRITAIS